MRVPTLLPAVKTGLSVFLVGVMGLLATGCASSTSQATIYPIRVWRYNQDVDPLRTVLNQFQGDYPNTVVTYENKSLDSYELNSLSSLASQTGPELWSFPNDWMGDEQSRLAIVPPDFFGPLKDNNGANAAAKIKQLYTADIANTLVGNDGNLYGFATNFDLLTLYYNDELFSQGVSNFQKTLGDSYDDTQYRPVQQLLSSPPATWSQVLQQIPYLTQKNGQTITTSAIALGTADNLPAAEDTLALLMYQNGTDITSSDHTRVLFNTQQNTPSGAIVRPGEKALSFFTSFAQPNSPNYTWNPSLPQALDAFGQGKVAMVLAYKDFGKKLEAKYPQMKFQTAPAPQINITDKAVNFGRYSIDTVTKAASNPNLALQLLYQIDKTDSASTLASESSMISPLVASLQQDNHDTSKQVLSARTLYKKNHTQFDADFLQMIRDVSQNGASASGAMDVAAQKINDLLTPPIAPPSASLNP